MFEVLFDTSTSFKSFSSLHWTPVFIAIGFMTLCILFAKYRLSEKRQITFGTALAIIPALCVMARMIFTLIEGVFSIQEELPIHLCRLLAFVMPIVLYYKNEKWFGITYFLTMVGTLQALLTPDLPNGPPHYSYYIYWVLHGVLIFLPIYCIVVYRFTITWRDFVNSVVVGNIYMIFTLLVNWILGSNYFYTAHKPPSPSLLDVLGPWPWYLLTVELLAIVLYIMAYLPFFISTKIKMKKSKYS